MGRTKDLTISPEKISMFKDHDEVMRRILAESKREVESLQQVREDLIRKNNQLSDDITRKQSQFEQWKRQEEIKFQETRNKLNNEVIRREKAIEIGELDLFRRTQEIERREAIGKSILEKETKLNNDRLDIEKLRSSASLMSDDAQRKMSNALSMESQANITFHKAKEIERKANEINDSITRRELAVDEKEKQVSSAVKNLEELKKIVEPKIQEIKLKEDKIEKEKKELLEKEQEVDKKITEEKVMIKGIEEEKKKLKDRSKMLDQKEEEVTRKALMAGLNGK